MATKATCDKLKCGLLNAQSVCNKTTEIRALINEENFDFLALTETWLNECDRTIIQEMTPVTHTFVHTPRKGRKGGGVGLVLPKICKKNRINTAEKFMSFEHMQVTCELSGRKTVFIVVYRPPNLSDRMFIDDFRKYLETLDMVSANVYICGDFSIWMDDRRNDTAKFSMR